jgi:hypothetical protein
MQIGGWAQWARMEGLGYRRSSAYRPESGSLPRPLKAEAVPFAPPLPYLSGGVDAARKRSRMERRPVVMSS